MELTKGRRFLKGVAFFFFAACRAKSALEGHMLRGRPMMVSDAV